MAVYVNKEGFEKSDQWRRSLLEVRRSGLTLLVSFLLWNQTTTDAKLLSALASLPSFSLYSEICDGDVTVPIQCADFDEPFPAVNE